MAYAEGSTEGDFNGSTIVDIVGSPAAITKRLISRIRIRNRDTVAHTFTVNYNTNGTRRPIEPIVLDAGEFVMLDDPLVLDATTKKIDGQIEGAHTTTAPDFVCTWADRS